LCFVQIINTIEEGFFITNIKAGYEKRKIRQADKGESKLSIDKDIYALLMGSNQIVHNKGRALAYMGNSEKKR
jgi:hypothetical protein